MQAVILAGGLGTRLSEETAVRPKPMVEIGDRPILWHIMKHLGTYGIEDFVVCLDGSSIVHFYRIVNIWYYFRHFSQSGAVKNSKMLCLHRDKWP